MKRLWMILSTIAIANLLAIGGFVGWLKMTDRLNRDRFENVKQMFRVTLAQEQQAKVDEEAAAAAAKVKAEADAKAALPPEPAADKIAEKQLQAEKELQQVQRRRQELESLKAMLIRQMADLERRESQLAAQKAAFDAERKRIADAESSSQFKAALATLEAQKPKDAKAVIKALLDSKQSAQAIDYLAKMDEGKRGKVMAEFVKDEPSLAADLLERIRTRGLAPATAPMPGGTSAVGSAAAAPDGAPPGNDSLAQGK